jgi:hypothetical protein
MAPARTRLRITNMMFPLMGRFAHSERVYPSPEHQSNHVTALSAREDGALRRCFSLLVLKSRYPVKLPIASRTEVKTCQRRGLRHSAMKKMGRAGKCWDEAKKDFKLPKYESMPGYANGLPC